MPVDYTTTYTEAEVAEMIKEAREDERKACAKILEEANTETSRKCIVDAIRARKD